MMANCHFEALARSNRLLVKDGNTALLIWATALKKVLDIDDVCSKDTFRNKKKAVSPQTAFSKYLLLKSIQMNMVRTDRMTYNKSLAKVIMTVLF